MAVLVICDEALERFANYLKATTPLANCELRLFKNNYTPVHGSVIGDFTEADFNGYAAITQSWTVAVMGSNRAVVTGNSNLWTKGAGGTGNPTIYGYYLTVAGGTPLIGGRRFASPIDMNDDDDVMMVQPTISFVDQDILAGGSSSFIWCNGQMTNLLTVLTGTGDGLNGTQLRLYKSNITPSRAGTYATYSGDEADFSGYAAHAISWAGAILVGDKGKLVANQGVFTKSGATGNTVYGHFLTDGSNRLIGALKYDSPVAMTSNGSQIAEQVVFTMESEA
jgi:hypothetical protein